ncbi:MAG: nitroreductase family protein [Bdellovibrionaceae bacterium]|nr:nitroreductase family protein [Pseudobdellovibrionaceae bacterium]
MDRVVKSSISKINPQALPLNNQSADPLPLEVSGQIKAILELAIRSPSGDNCQPWRFSVTKSSLEIGIDHALAQHTFNNRHHASLISLGMLVESIALVSPELGLYAQVQWLAAEFINLDRKSPWVRITFANASLAANQSAWITAIQSRSTQRGEFSATGVVLSHPKFNFMKQCDSPLVSASVLSGEQARSTATLIEFICKSEQYVFSNPSALRDLFHWVRFSKHETQTSQDGMPWRSLGLRRTEALLFKALKRFPVLQNVFSPMVKIVIASQTRRKVGRAGGIALLSVKTATPEAVFEAGRVAMRQWLQLEQLGLAVQPISAASICVFDVASGAAPASMPAAYKTLYRNGLGTLMDAFCLNAGETPIWMYRFGQLATKPTQETPRRTLASFLIGR